MMTYPHFPYSTSKSPQCNYGYIKPKSEFFIIGHSGGDPLNHCENTKESTRSALENGANAIEIDLAISKDNIVFLWHDPSPWGLHAIARRY